MTKGCAAEKLYTIKCAPKWKRLRIPTLLQCFQYDFVKVAYWLKDIFYQHN
jgi:hypothetical protein